VKEVYVVKMAKFRHNLHSQIRKIMKNSIKKVQSQTGLNSAERENVGLKVKKYIELSEEVIARLVSGKCVEGSLHRDKWTGKVTFWHTIASHVTVSGTNSSRNCLGDG
jgi:hypothetical protein